MKKITFFLIASFLIIASLTGCKEDEEKKEEAKRKMEIILTTDFEENEVFRIDGISCYLPEIMVYLVNSENSYYDIFGSEIWDVKVDNTTIGQEYKDTIMARIAQIKVMNLLADEEQYSVMLTEEEQSLAAQAAHEYFSSLSKPEVDILGANETLITHMYEEFAIADKLYHTITDDINPEISDDEARAVTVKSILIKTYRLDNVGNKIEYGDVEKQMAYNIVCEARDKLDEGTEFDIVSADYNEDTKSEYSFGRNVMPKEIEDAAFNLDNGERSDIIESEYGYHILQCVSNYDREETDNNKQLIVEKKRQETFNAIYDDYVKSLTSNLNGPLYDEISYSKSDAVNTTDFFEVYNRYFDSFIK